MQQDFYKSKLVERGLQVFIPKEEDIELINSIIFNELCMGIISEKSKGDFLRIIQYLSEQGAEGMILGCTEIGLLIQQVDTEIPLFDTAFIHAKRASLMAMEA